MNNDRTHSAVQSSVPNPGWGDVDSDRLGYDGAGRMITKRYLAGGIDGETHAYNDPTAIVGATTAFDRASNKFYERSLQAESRSSLYQPRDKATAAVSGLGYDSVDRLRQYQRGILNDDTGGNTGGSEIATPISLPGTDEARTYDLDGLGNWKKTVFTPEGGSETTQRRDHNHLNQITRTKENSTEVDFSYDGSAGSSNGNLANDGVRSYTYDALNRLTQVFKDPNDTPTLIGIYTYDALGRRIRKVVSNNGLTGDITNGTTDFIYTGWRCCEERDGSNNPVRQYVWGIYIDELLQMRDDISGTPVDRYMLSDLLYRGTALTDATGAIVEAYDTDAYGNTLIFDAPGTGSDWWAVDASTTNEPTCQFIFTGRRYDPETQIYFYRARYYVQQWGRFLQRDPLGYVDGMSLYGGDGNGVATVDPWGTDKLSVDDWKRSKTFANLNNLKARAVYLGIPTGAIDHLLKTQTVIGWRTGDEPAHSSGNVYLPKDYWFQDPRDNSVLIQGVLRGNLTSGQLQHVFDELSHAFWYWPLQNETCCQWLLKVFEKEASLFFGGDIQPVKEAVSVGWSTITRELILQETTRTHVRLRRTRKIGGKWPLWIKPITRQRVQPKVVPQHGYKNQPLSTPAFYAMVHMLKHGCDAPRAIQNAPGNVIASQLYLMNKYSNGLGIGESKFQAWSGTDPKLEWGFLP